MSNRIGISGNRTRNKAGKKFNNRETVLPRFRKSTRHGSGRNNRRKNSTSPGKEAGVLERICEFILRVWFLCRYEVTSKDELLQEIYLEKEKSPPE